MTSDVTTLTSLMKPMTSFIPPLPSLLPGPEERVEVARALEVTAHGR
jgi:hypothetical protein